MHKLIKNISVWQEGKFELKDRIYLDQNGLQNSPDAFEYEEIDGTGKFLIPGLTDISVYMNDFEMDIEYSIEHLIQAMKRGGFSKVFIDSKLGHQNVYSPETFLLQSSCIPDSSLKTELYTHIRQSDKNFSIVEFFEVLKRKGKLFSNGLDYLPNPGYLRTIMEYASQFNVRLFLLPQNKTLSENSHVNESTHSDLLGMKGNPKESELISLYTILSLAKLTSCPVHIKHVTLKESVDLITSFKEQGVDATCDSSLWHLCYEESSIMELNTNKNIYPPLRSEEDRFGLLSAFYEGKIDILTTQHTPVLHENKFINYEDSEKGIVGLEQAMNILYSTIANKDLENLASLLKGFITGPEKVLSESNARQYFIWDPAQSHQLSSSDFIFTSNSPFLGEELSGKIECFFHED